MHTENRVREQLFLTSEHRYIFRTMAGIITGGRPQFLRIRAQRGTRGRTTVEDSEPSEMNTGVIASLSTRFIITSVSGIYPQVVQIVSVEQVFDTDDQLGVVAVCRECTAKT